MRVFFFLPPKSPSCHRMTGSSKDLSIQSSNAYLLAAVEYLQELLNGLLSMRVHI